ncbi:Na+/H+ antiporter NhaC [Alkalihalobacillus trypoxylicola]|uniref:Na+/H+ antiporter NhaC n=1 Tax=Alkalihalobacillus trypoxylicola TaxID=519424 RepID=A0A162E965_9BACI|nr:Na+/H+ antiporter NhaC [Alkalihalobacillus trypoxylicola]KYG32082.1 Na+/H+ antiporter NhaC [Alkalihalobacillus trypoxylicola]
MKHNHQVLSKIEAIFCMVMMLLIMVGGIFILKVDPHIPLLICVSFLLVMGLKNKFTWAELEKSMIDGLIVGIKPLIILALVGMVIGVWMMSGTVPTLLFYGLQIITPQYFAISALLICIVISSFTGSSFTTVGTIGIALFGVGTALGLNPALVAGAVISGACFGDKMSPLSDTTNLAAAIVEIDLFEHIKHLMWTMVPSLLITMLFFFFSGVQTEAISSAQMENLLTSIQDNFQVSALTLLSPLLVLFLAFKRCPTILIISSGILSGIITTIIVQNVIDIGELLMVLQSGFQADIADPTLANIVNRGGLQSMMWSISLVMIALVLGGVFQKVGILQVLINGLSAILRKEGNVIAATATTSIAVNAMTGEQYLSILIPGKMFKPFYSLISLHPKNLSRTLEDAGTLVNPLIPWGVSGAFFASVLGVSVIEYTPYAIFLFVSPLLTILFGYLGIGIARTNKK